MKEGDIGWYNENLIRSVSSAAIYHPLFGWILFFICAEFYNLVVFNYFLNENLTALSVQPSS